MRNYMRNTKNGVASFYMVAFSTLILLVVVMGFAALVVSQMERSSNDDLSQSAYDAALAGVEDAKLAYEKYAECKQNNSADGCQDVLARVNSGECGMVGAILGRPDLSNDKNAPSGVVPIKEETNGGDNRMQQFYTCVKIKPELSSQTGFVGGKSKKMSILRPQFKNGHNDLESLNSIKLSWDKNEPIWVAIVQMSGSDGVNFEDLVFQPMSGEEPVSNYNRMIYLNPATGIGSQEVSLGNTREAKFDALCEDGGDVDDAKCDIKIYLSTVDKRSDFGVMIFNPNDEGTTVNVGYYKKKDNEEDELLTITNQFEIESTGRANDMLKRVRVVMDTESLEPISVMGPLEVTD